MGIAQPNEADLLALERVIQPVISDFGMGFVRRNYRIKLLGGATRRVDFAVTTPRSWIAIEIATGRDAASPATLHGDRERATVDEAVEPVAAGWTVIRVTTDDLHQNPHLCRDQLRRSLIGDGLLHRNFAVDRLEPTELQLEALDALARTRQRGFSAGLVCLPTGTGKTMLAALDAAQFSGRILFIVHSNEILKQAARQFQRVISNRSTGFLYTHERSPAAEMVFANICSLKEETLKACFSPGDFEYVIFDEFHHGAASSYHPVLSYFKPKFKLGMTATPDRTDRRDILSLLEDNLVYSATTANAINRGFLCPFAYFGFADNIDYSSIKHNGFRYELGDLERSLMVPRRDRAILEKYQEHLAGKKAIGFCVSIKHAERMAALFEEQGIPSVAVHSRLPPEDRARAVEYFESGAATCAFVRDMFNEGVDFPDTAGLMFLRPTESRIIFQQQLGRGLRLAPGKETVTVLDFIGNYVGVADIPAMVAAYGSRGLDIRRDRKPEFVFDNGCQVVFSEEAVANFLLSKRPTGDRVHVVQDVMRLFEIEGRPLIPIDLAARTIHGLGYALSCFGSWSALADRMNSLGHGEVIKLSDENADASFVQLPDEESALAVAAAVGEQFHEALRAMAQISKTPMRGSALDESLCHINEIIGKCCELVSLLLINSDILQLGDAEAPADFARPDEECWEASFWKRLAKHSYSRDVISLSNYAKKQMWLFHAVALQEFDQLTVCNRYVLSKLLSRSMLDVLCDFYAMTKR